MTNTNEHPAGFVTAPRRAEFYYTTLSPGLSRYKSPNSHTISNSAGAPETPDQAARVTRPGGKVIVVGIPSDDAMTLTAGVTRRKGLTIKLVRRMKHTYPRAIALVQRGVVDVKPLVTHVFPLERIAEAFEIVANYDDGVLRAVIQVADAF